MIRRAAGKIPHVCVIGAGVAGLRCADVLLKQGVKVTILEGRNRVGGRVSIEEGLREFLAANEEAVMSKQFIRPRSRSVSSSVVLLATYRVS